MHLLTSVLPLILSSFVAGVPWGPRSLVSRDTPNSWPVSRRFALESRMAPPPTCVGRKAPPVNVTLPDPTEIVGTNETTPTEPVPTEDPAPTETEDPAPTETEDPAPTDETATTNSTLPDDSEAASNSTDAPAADARKRSHPSFSKVILGEFSSLSEWQTFCTISGGDFFDWDLHGEFGCINWAGIDATFALLPEADPCEQQHNADLMITFAKASRFKVKERIAQAIAYRKYPRSVTTILGVVPASPYCLEVPINTELIGIYNEQLIGVNYGLYGGPNYPIISFGSDGTCPLGWTPDIDSCTCIESTGDVTTAVLPTETPTATSAEETPTETDTASDVAETTTATDDAPVEAETAVADDDDDEEEDSTVSETATATDVDADAAATGAAGIDGDINDPNGR